jgi:hypothetical protein
MVLSVRFYHYGREFELCSTWPAGASPLRDGFDRVEVTVGLEGIWTARQCLKSCDTWRLRAIAQEADGEPGVRHQQFDAGVHATIVRMMQQGRLRLYELLRRAWSDEKPCEATSASSLPVTPSMLRATPAAATPTTTQTAAAAVSLPDIDQDRQAGGLRRAAVAGVPFCEVCEKAEQAKMAALDAHLATTA